VCSHLHKFSVCVSLSPMDPNPPLPLSLCLNVLILICAALCVSIPICAAALCVSIPICAAHIWAALYISIPMCAACVRRSCRHLMVVRRWCRTTARRIPRCWCRRACLQPWTRWGSGAYVFIAGPVPLPSGLPTTVDKLAFRQKHCHQGPGHTPVSQ